MGLRVGCLDVGSKVGVGVGGFVLVGLEVGACVLLVALGLTVGCLVVGRWDAVGLRVG